MKDISKREGVVSKDEICRKAKDLVVTYLNYKGQYLFNSAICTRMTSKVMQALTEEGNQTFSFQSDAFSAEKDQDICSVGVKEEWDSHLKKIGIQEHEPLEKVFLSKLAERSFDLGSMEEPERKDESNSFTSNIKFEREDNMKHQSLQAMNEQPTNLRYFYMDYKPKTSTIQFYEQTNFHKRKLPKVQYQQSISCISKSEEDKEDQSQYHQSSDIEASEKPRRSLRNNSFNVYEGQKRSKMSQVAEGHKSRLYRNYHAKKTSKKVDQSKGQERKVDVREIANLPKGRRPQNPQMQKRLVPWITREISEGKILTQRDIREKARNIAEELQTSKFRKFNASKGWVQKFFKRYPAISSLVSRRNKELSQQKILSRYSAYQKQLQIKIIQSFSPSDRGEKTKEEKQITQQ